MKLQKDLALVRAYSIGHLDIVDTMVQNVLNDEGECLNLASKNGHLTVVEYLLNLGIDFGNRLDMTVSLASRNSRWEVVKSLVQMFILNTTKPCDSHRRTVI
jgi:hypothetical protein